MKFTVDYSVRRKRQYFDTINRYNLVHEDKDYFFEQVKDLISKGEREIIIQQSPEKVIECRLIEDRFYDGFIPQVIKSSHEQFTPGTRFDYGFMLCSIKDGFTIIYHPLTK